MQTATSVSRRFISIDGHSIFLREAGQPHAPAIVLLHGFPSSSHMFRDLMPLLAANFRVIAPDMLGFGYSDAPSAGAFTYTFDALSAITSKLLDRLEVRDYILYMHDYGGPIGFRLATRAPERVRGLVIQNANAYMDGVSEAVTGLFMPLWNERNAKTEGPARGFMSAAATKGQYTTGARSPATLNPDAWTLDQALLERPGNADIQLDLFVDYKNNVAAYDTWHAYLRQHAPRTLVAWGKNDPFFTVAGAHAFTRDVPNAEVMLFDTGHFALEEFSGEIARAIGRVFQGSYPQSQR